MNALSPSLLTLLLLGTSLPLYCNCNSCELRSASHRDDLSRVGYYEDTPYFNSRKLHDERENPNAASAVKEERAPEACPQAALEPQAAPSAKKTRQRRTTKAAASENPTDSSTPADESAQEQAPATRKRYRSSRKLPQPIPPADTSDAATPPSS